MMTFIAFESVNGDGEVVIINAKNIKKRFPEVGDNYDDYEWYLKNGKEFVVNKLFNVNIANF